MVPLINAHPQGSNDPRLKATAVGYHRPLTSEVSVRHRCRLELENAEKEPFPTITQSEVFTARATVTKAIN